MSRSVASRLVPVIRPCATSAVVAAFAPRVLAGVAAPTAIAMMRVAASLAARLVKDFVGLRTSSGGPVMVPIVGLEGATPHRRLGAVVPEEGRPVDGCLRRLVVGRPAKPDPGTMT